VPPRNAQRRPWGGVVEGSVIPQARVA